MAEAGAEATSAYPCRRCIPTWGAARHSVWRRLGSVEIPQFQTMARDAGRDPASIEITSFGLAEDLDRLKRLMDVGVARVVPMFLLEKSDKVLPIIDRWTKLMQQASG